MLIFPCYSYSADEWVDEAKLHYEKGNDFYEQKKFKQAEEEYQKALLAMPNYTKTSGDSLAQKPEEEIKTQGVLQYRIGFEDALRISVWEWDNLTQETIVRPDGMISVPLIGDVQAAGLTVLELKEVITKGLKEYIKSPQVSITITKLGGNKVMVLGEVSDPGVYTVTGKKTLLEAIALASGFTKDAVISSVIVIKGGFQNPQGERINLNRAITKADMSQNITLDPEDIVYVPKKFIANVKYFVTEVLGVITQGEENADKIRTGIRSGAYYRY